MVKVLPVPADASIIDELFKSKVLISRGSGLFKFLFFKFSLAIICSFPDFLVHCIISFRSKFKNHS